MQKGESYFASKHETVIAELKKAHELFSGPFSEIFIKNEDLEGNCAYCGFEYTYDEHKICAHSNGDKSSFYYTIPYSIVTQFALNFGEIWFYVYPVLTTFFTSVKTISMIAIKM